MSQLRFLNMGISFKSDIDDCSNSNTCQNSGTCHDLVNDYMCICVPGYTDKNCSTGNMGLVQHFSLHHNHFSMAQQYKRKNNNNNLLHQLCHSLQYSYILIPPIISAIIIVSIPISLLLSHHLTMLLQILMLFPVIRYVYVCASVFCNIIILYNYIIIVQMSYSSVQMYYIIVHIYYVIAHLNNAYMTILLSYAEEVRSCVLTSSLSKSIQDD